LDKLREGKEISFSFLYKKDVFNIELSNSILSGRLSPTTRMETSLDGADATNAVTKELQMKNSDAAVKEESDVLALATHDKVRLTVVKFTEEDPVLKWFLRIMSVMLIVCLAFLWIYYR